MPGRHVLVVDDHDTPCPAGVTGEIVIRSPFVTPGYLGAASGETTPFRSLAGHDEHRPGQPAPRTYRTGDLGRWRWDGALEFRGRKDFQVKLLGNRLELSDVEVALAEHDTVAECAVVALQDSDGLATGLVAYVVARPTPDGAVGSPEIWRAHLRSRFGRSMLPVSFRAIDSRLPRNVGGKVDRRRLPDPGAVAAAPSTPPRTPTERGVVEIFSRVLGADGVAADTSFFAAGGGSLTVQTVLRQIKDRFDVEVSLWDFFANPTPASLATAIDASERTQSPQGNKQRADSD